MAADDAEAAAPLAVPPRPRPRLHLGHTVFDASSPIPPVKAHQANLARLSATLHFLALLATTTTVSSKLLQEVLAVVYEPINSSSEDHVRGGAVALFHLLQCGCTTTTESDGDTTTTTNNNGNNVWCAPAMQVVADNLVSMLHEAVKLHRTGATLAVLGAVQHKLFRRAFPWNDDNHCNNNKRRRTVVAALRQWLHILDRNNCHYAQDLLVWGLLYGGIVPLLYDCASSSENAAACVEVGRLGLSALLPVLRGGAEATYGGLAGLRRMTTTMAPAAPMEAVTWTRKFPINAKALLHYRR